MTRETYIEIDEYTTDDLEVLADSGVPLHVAAKRMGYKNPATLDRNLHRQGKIELYRRLVRNSHESGYTRLGKIAQTKRDRNGRFSK